MPQTAYVGIDVACAKRKRLPLAVCVFSVGRLETMPLRDWSTRPPLGEGNLMALETEFQERFAEDTVRYLREVEAHFSVKIKRIAIDAPSDARSADARKGVNASLHWVQRTLATSKTRAGAEFEGDTLADRETCERWRARVASPARKQTLDACRIRVIQEASTTVGVPRSAPPGNSSHHGCCWCAQV